MYPDGLEWVMFDWLSALKPRVNEVFRPEGKFFYGWVMVLACAAIQWLSAVTWMHSYGAYTVLLQAEFGWSMTILSLAFALTRLESGLLGPIQGWLVDRFGPRKILTIGLVIFAIGFFLFSQVNSIPTYFLAFILIALGSSLGGWATLMVPIVHWFDRHRAKAIAWSQLGFSLGGLCVPLMAIGLEAFGWRQMGIISGAVILLAGIPLISLIYHRPSDVGLSIDGLKEKTKTNGEIEERLPVKSFTWREAIKEPSFWFLSTGHSLSLLAVSSMLAHLIPHLTNVLNYSLRDASIAFSLMTGLQLIGIFLGGYLGDKYDKQRLVIFCMIGHFLGLIAIAYASNFLWIIAFAVFHGIAWGIRGPLMVALRADYFGPKSFGTIMGFSSLVVMIGMTCGPIICGVLYDYYGNYEIAFSLMASASLIGAICFWLCKTPQKQIGEETK